MFFVTAVNKVYGPYWNRTTATDVQGSVVAHYNRLGQPARALNETQPCDAGTISVRLIERQILRDANEWQQQFIPV
jgi:hypothetical protein